MSTPLLLGHHAGEPAAVTADLDIDEPAYRRHLRWLADTAASPGSSPTVTPPRCPRSTGKSGGGRWRSRWTRWAAVPGGRRGLLRRHPRGRALARDAKAEGAAGVLVFRPAVHGARSRSPRWSAPLLGDRRRADCPSWASSIRPPPHRLRPGDLARLAGIRRSPRSRTGPTTWWRTSGTSARCGPPAGRSRCCRPTRWGSWRASWSGRTAPSPGWGASRPTSRWSSSRPSEGRRGRGASHR